MAKRLRTDNSRPDNRLLAALPRTKFDRLTARMDDVSFAVRDMTYQTNGPITHVYFPRSGMLSIVVVMESGATSEVSVVGNEGIAGMPVFLGTNKSHTEVFCQMPCETHRMTTTVFKEKIRGNGPLRT